MDSPNYPIQHNTVTKPLSDTYDDPDSVFTRRSASPIGKYILILAILIQVAFIAFSHYLFHSENSLPNPDFIKYIYILYLGVPILSISLFPLYFLVLNFFKSELLKIYISITIIGALIPVIIAFITGFFQTIITSLLMLVINFVFLWCLWGKLKLATISIKAALQGLKYKYFSIFKKFVLPLLLAAVLFGLWIISSTKLIFLCEADPEDPDKFKYISVSMFKVLLALCISSLVSIIYSIETLAAVSYIFGAAYFNQTSLKVQNSGGNNHSKTVIDYDLVKDESAHIAFKSSLGVACIGAFVITIVSLLRGKAESEGKKSNASLGAVLLACLMIFLDEIVRFLTSQAYVYTAIYGRDILESGKMGLESFKTAGFEKYFNYNLCNRILNLMSFVMCSAVGILGYYFSRYLGEGIFYDESWVDREKVRVSILVGFVVADAIFLPFYSINSIIGGNASTQIALFVEDPDRLNSTHPEIRRFTKYIEA